MASSRSELATRSFVFLDQGDLDQFHIRKQVRSRAAEHSHRVGPRKPKQSKKKRKKKQKGENVMREIIEPASPTLDHCEGSPVSAAPSSGPSSLTTEGHACSRTYTPFPNFVRIGGSVNEPFDAYPVPAQPWFPLIMQYMWEFMLRGWDALPATTSSADRATALLWVQRLTLAEPTYFLMNMLSVAGDLAQRGRLNARVLWWLNSQVVAALNAALNDARPALSTATVLTVGRIALREIVVGDRDTGQALHRPMFAKMILMCGGTDALGLPALVRDHLAWAERVMRRKTGVSIAELEPGLSADPTFATFRQCRPDDKRVLDSYLPLRPPTSDGL